MVSYVIIKVAYDNKDVVLVVFFLLDMAMSMVFSSTQSILKF